MLSSLSPSSDQHRSGGISSTSHGLAAAAATATANNNNNNNSSTIIDANRYSQQSTTAIRTRRPSQAAIYPSIHPSIHPSIFACCLLRLSRQPSTKHTHFSCFALFLLISSLPPVSSPHTTPHHSPSPGGQQSKRGTRRTGVNIIVIVMMVIEPSALCIGVLWLGHMCRLGQQTFMRV